MIAVATTAMIISVFTGDKGVQAFSIISLSTLDIAN